jgi:hypothetical protein
MVEKLNTTKGNYFSISKMCSTFVLHPNISEKKGEYELNNLSITGIGDNDLFSYYYIFPNHFDKILIPLEYLPLLNAIEKFKHREELSKNYINCFDDTIKLNTFYEGKTYQEVALITKSLKYLYFCISHLHMFNFEIDSKLLGLTSIEEMSSLVNSDKSKLSLENFIQLTKQKNRCFENYEENRSYEQFGSEEDISSFDITDEMINDGLDDAFGSNSENYWNID